MSDKPELKARRASVYSAVCWIRAHFSTHLKCICLITIFWIFFSFRFHFRFVIHNSLNVCWDFALWQLIFRFWNSTIRFASKMLNIKIKFFWILKIVLKMKPRCGSLWIFSGLKIKMPGPCSMVRCMTCWSCKRAKYKNIRFQRLEINVTKTERSSSNRPAIATLKID